MKYPYTVCDPSGKQVIQADERCRYSKETELLCWEPDTPSGSMGKSLQKQKSQGETKMQVGDKVRKPLTDFTSGNPNTPRPIFTGTVVWVYPEGRFYLAEFRLKAGTVRECFTD